MVTLKLTKDQASLILMILEGELARIINDPNKEEVDYQTKSQLYAIIPLLDSHI